MVEIRPRVCPERFAVTDLKEIQRVRDYGEESREIHGLAAKSREIRGTRIAREDPAR